MSSKIITSNNYAGERMTLVDEDTHLPIHEGDVRASFRGDLYRVMGGRAPHKESSTGKVWCRDPLAKRGDDSSSSEFYPGVIKARWVVDWVVATHRCTGCGFTFKSERAFEEHAPLCTSGGKHKPAGEMSDAELMAAYQTSIARRK